MFTLLVCSHCTACVFTQFTLFTLAGTSDVWLLLIIVIFFSRFSSVKLGRDDEKPEFSDIAYFTMLFAGGVGIGLFYFGVSEPVSHYAPATGNRFQDGYVFSLVRFRLRVDIASFHTMLFLGLFYFGVSEPVSHCAPVSPSPSLRIVE